MPDAKDNAKASGDIHPPEVERGSAPSQENSPQGAGERSRTQEEATPGRGINQAGFLKDRDAPTSDSYDNTRDAGETGQS
jgi:hypothetical protein